MAKIRKKVLNPYADKDLAMMNADWIKHVDGGKAKERDLAIHGELEKRYNDIPAKSLAESQPKVSFTQISAALSILKGGKGSGNWGHAGRPGKVGGSSPQDSAPPHTVAGITPYHTTNPLSREEVDARGKQLAEDLAKIPTVSNVVYNGVGSGGWEGDAEPTLIISYDGNGEGIKLITKYGKEWKQDGVLLRRRTTEDDPDAQPAFRVVFDEVLGEKSRKFVEDTVVAAAKEAYGDANIGWTWWQKDGKMIFDSQSVSQWGGDAEKHLSVYSRLMEVIAAKAKGEVTYFKVGIMDNDSYSTDSGYSKVISGEVKPFEGDK